MSDEREIPFPTLDEPTPPPAVPSYYMPLVEWNKVVDLANHLAKREAEMPLRRRIASYLAARRVTWGS